MGITGIAVIVADRGDLASISVATDRKTPDYSEI
jgi:hypothetical protein